MTRIWKYRLEILDRQEVTMPLGARVLSVGLDPFGKLCVWAEVDPGAPREPKVVRIIGTGNEFTRSGCGEFIGSVTMPPFVWHVFVTK